MINRRRCSLRLRAAPAPGKRANGRAPPILKRERTAKQVGETDRSCLDLRPWVRQPRGPVARPSAVHDFHKTPSARPHGRAWLSRPRPAVQHRAPGAVQGSRVCVGRKDLLSWGGNAAVRKRFRRGSKRPHRGKRKCATIQALSGTAPPTLLPKCQNNPMHSSRCLSDQDLMRPGSPASQNALDASGKTPA